MTEKLKIWMIAGLAVIVTALVFLIRNRSLRLEAAQHKLNLIKIDSDLKNKETEYAALAAQASTQNVTNPNAMYELETEIAVLNEKRKKADEAYKRTNDILNRIKSLK